MSLECLPRHPAVAYLYLVRRHLSSVYGGAYERERSDYLATYKDRREPAESFGDPGEAPCTCSSAAGSIELDDSGEHRVAAFFGGAANAGNKNYLAACRSSSRTSWIPFVQVPYLVACVFGEIPVTPNHSFQLTTGRKPLTMI